ncbi:multidrug effflux MFS transporter [Futiania mangrovi]|uniref:Bcr/CflA family efflux transporter n=1 Tax=Futiania mangrovi TaxID=2959716 RepID=A0A9J6P7Q5_9PROT|nr:multidrug effflux MFS transporter [Futiania mangrovii]MCP1334964.1 multidrug effflux MFS transporter [Futiania mangrovii]
MPSYATDPATPAIAGDPEPRQMPPRRMVPLLAGITAVAPLAINIYIPSLPNIAAALGTDAGTVQLTVTLYLIAVAAGQVTLGPLSDRMGRRPVLITGMIVYVIASLAAAAAPDVWWLIVARVFQAIGGCAGLVLGRAIVRDIYDRDTSASMLGYVTTVMVIVPMAAPTVGGLLDVAFGWRSSFVLVAALGAVMLGLILTSLPETHPPAKGSQTSTPIRGESLQLLRSRAFLGYAGATSFGAGMYFAFIAGAPFLVVDAMGREPYEYGLWFILVAGGYMTGNYISGRTARRVGLDKLLAIGAVLAAFGGAVLVLSSSLLPLTPPTLFIPMILLSIANGFTTANGIAGAVSVNPRLAGSASGIAGAAQMLVGAAATQVVGSAMSSSALPTTLTVFAFALLLLSCWLFLIRPARQAVLVRAAE